MKLRSGRTYEREEIPIENHLIWLARHDRLMTSNLKMKMTLIQCDVCPICQSASETTTHVIKDCSWAYQEWVDWALSTDLGKMENPDWDLTFRTSIRHIWTWRNKAVHNNQSMPLFSHVQLIKKQVLEILDAMTRTSIKQKQEVLLERKFPRQGWVKLNMDGSATGCPGWVGGVGFFRND
ncbi:hypothetical protein ACH5RR_030553 [Cinchona calisaya]|uniref:Reverse transcriptase zinc-binding domain-containing protein n=1 Tax=Cinchona calisaya TaxID=153742 RepID=A0ABD2YUZ3_9GENT